MSKIRSSYIKNNYGNLIQSLIKVTSPQCCVEFGVLDGFSTIIIGHALKLISNFKKSNRSDKPKLYAFDLFENYPYTNSKYCEIKSRIEKFGLSDYITLKEQNIYDPIYDFERCSVDFMHVDVSNTGETLNKVINAWDKYIRPGGILIFEGGSPLRDEIPWMNIFEKEKIYPELNTNKRLKANYTSLVLHPYPSMLLCCKIIQYNSKNSDMFGYHNYPQNKKYNEISDKELFDFLSKSEYFLSE